MFTEVRRIDMSQSQDLAKEISTLSDNMLAGGFALAATFTVGEDLVLIYQKSKP